MCNNIEKKKKFMWVWSCVVLFFMVGSSLAFAKHDQVLQAEIQGYVDSFDIENDKVVVQGWVGITDSVHEVVSFSVWLGAIQIYEGMGERLERPDVVSATGHFDWLQSGWRVSAALPGNLKNGEYSLKVLVMLDNGSAEKLAISSQIEKITIDERLSQLIRTARNVKLILIFMCCVLVGVYFQAHNLSKVFFSITHYSINAPVIFGFTLLLSFLALLSMGLTGSSLRIGLQQTSFVQSDIINVFGKNQFIRGDEYLVFTPFSMAQYNHFPKFPIVNTNIGEDGQNMLVVGMTGVPVAHVSSIAKPATWGFFLFDLQRALSWYWYFPIFACLFALWGVIALLLPGNWRASFLVALWFSVSPYVAAWSNWPAYAVFFPSLAFISVIAILRAQSNYLLVVLGCILGVVLAGFVLLLYPPWQVSLAYVFFALLIGIVVRDKLYRNFNAVRLVAFGIAIMISGLILWEWWRSAHLAIQAMLSTVYPGQRSAVVGGSVSFPYLLRGVSNFITLHKIDGAYSNQSEIASFCYLLLPLLLSFVLRLYQKAVGVLEIVLVASISFILYFMLVGVPVEVAQFSLWGRVTPQRADIALGLSYIILCGLLLSPGMKCIPNKMSIRITAFVVALVWTTIAFNRISHIHASILSGFSPGVFVGLFFVVVIAGYCLAMGKFQEFIYLNLALSVATIWPFNPINIAPHGITTTSFINGFNEKKSGHVASQRILVLETQVPAMYLLASGLPVVNGVFYYPQSSLWERLDKNHTEANTYNRYQHLIFSGGVVENRDNYRIESPFPDQVRVVVNLERFDFRKTGAGFIAAPQYEGMALRKNTALTYMKNEKGWSWFQVTGDLNAN